jgi:D-beta-D-heptose 7-phosphate kinase/D-beta-D-heptose 1-phosphate adenosyltransferase
MRLCLSHFSKIRVLVIGDLMIDEYLWGRVERISPEAPVPVVAVDGESETLGGAGNVVNNVVALGASAVAVGVVGADAAGHGLQDRFAHMGVDTCGVLQVHDRPTIRKTRVIASHQQVVRIDREKIGPLPASVQADLTRMACRALPDVDVVLVSDYGKGVVTAELIATLVTAKADKIIVVDPKGLDFGKYRGVDYLTPNRKEASLAAGMDIGGSAGLERVARHLLETAGVANLLITLGEDGMALFCPDKPFVHIPAQARQVFDVSGAGDTVLAVFGLSLACGTAPEQAAAMANAAAGIVVGKLGTATVTAAELEQALGMAALKLPAKFKSPQELAKICGDLHRRGERIVMTNGCFDLIHAGHIQLLTASRRFGDVLVVAIDDDVSVAALKGPGRPVVGADQRVAILSALDPVDYVTVFATEKLADLIARVKPDVLTKGSNWRLDQVAGRRQVEDLGGRVVLIPVAEEISASRIIRGIQNSVPDSGEKGATCQGACPLEPQKNTGRLPRCQNAEKKL